MNSALIEFSDGEQYVVSRNALRRFDERNLKEGTSPKAEPIL
jgi:hypothetical protein